jgi:hypothetical protein
MRTRVARIVLFGASSFSGTLGSLGRSPVCGRNPQIASDAGLLRKRAPQFGARPYFWPVTNSCVALAVPEGRVDLSVF